MPLKTYAFEKPLDNQRNFTNKATVGEYDARIPVNQKLLACNTVVLETTNTLHIFKRRVPQKPIYGFFQFCHAGMTETV